MPRIIPGGDLRATMSTNGHLLSEPPLDPPDDESEYEDEVIDVDDDGTPIYWRFERKTTMDNDDQENEDFAERTKLLEFGTKVYALATDGQSEDEPVHIARARIELLGLVKRLGDAAKVRAA